MIELQTLGAIDLRGIPTAAARSLLARPRRFGLLAYLALARPYGRQSRDTILGLFWPESDETRARLALRQAVHQIRQSLGDEIITGRGSEGLSLSTEIRCDAREFENALSRNDLEAALDLYKGDLLPGFFLSDAPGFDNWLSQERERFRASAARAAHTLAIDAASHADHRTAARFARRRLEITPDDEEAVRDLMNQLAISGDRAAALRVYDSYSAKLHSEWEEAPGADTVALADDIRSRKAVHATPAAPVQPTSIPVAAAPEQIDHVTLPDAVAVRRPRSTFRTGFFATLATLAIGMFALIAWKFAVDRSSGVAADPTSHSVVVFPFNARGMPTWSYLGDGMMDLLGTKLDGAGELQAIDPRATLSMLRESRDGSPAKERSIAAKLGARWYVTGSIFADSSGLQIGAILYDAVTGKPVARSQAEGAPSNLFSMVDEITVQLLAGSQKGPAGKLERLALKTTTSLSALKDYLQGEAHFRGGEYDDAVSDFQRATAKDSTFALAIYRLSVASDFAGLASDTVNTYAWRAERLDNRLGLQERLLVEAYAAQRSRHYANAIDLYERLIGMDPTNVEALYQLADIQFHQGPNRGFVSDESRGTFEKVLRYDPYNESALVHLVRLAGMNERWTELDSLSARVLAIHPAGDEALEMRALRGVALGDEKALAIAIDTLRESNAVRIQVTARRAAIYGGNPERAIPLYVLLTNPEMPAQAREVGFLGIADIEAARGHWRGARARLVDAKRVGGQQRIYRAVSYASSPFIPMSPDDRVKARDELEEMLVKATGSRDPAVQEGLLKTDKDLRPFYLMAQVEARTGREASALRRLSLLEKRAARMPNDSQIVQIERLLRTYVALTNDSVRKVLSTTWPVDGSERSTGRAEYFEGDKYFHLAELARQLGRNEDALLWYTLASQSEYTGLIYVAPSQLRRAQILETMGRRSEAAAHYERFSALWETADRELQRYVLFAKSQALAIRRAR